MTDIRHYSRSDIGRERQLNEDAWCVDEALGLWGVFDGMGGHGGGDIASKLAASGMLERVKAGNSLEEALMAAHTAIVEAAARGDGAASMGCTAVAVLINNGRYTLSWVGDSRCYLLDEHNTLWQLSSDHSYVQRLVDDGVIDDCQASHHPERHVVSQCLGDQKGVPIPESLTGTLCPGQRLLLCSDGLSGEVDDDIIEDILCEHRADEAASQALIEAANAAGGADNITVAVISYGDWNDLPVTRRKQQRLGKSRTVPMHAVGKADRKTDAPASVTHKARYFLGGVSGALIVLFPVLMFMRPSEIKPRAIGGGALVMPVVQEFESTVDTLETAEKNVESQPSPSPPVVPGKVEQGVEKTSKLDLFTTSEIPAGVDASDDPEQPTEKIGLADARQATEPPKKERDKTETKNTFVHDFVNAVSLVSVFIPVPPVVLDNPDRKSGENVVEKESDPVPTEENGNAKFENPVSEVVEDNATRPLQNHSENPRLPQERVERSETSSNPIVQWIRISMTEKF